MLVSCRPSVDDLPVIDIYRSTLWLWIGGRQPDNGSRTSHRQVFLGGYRGDEQTEMVFS